VDELLRFDHVDVHFPGHKGKVLRDIALSLSRGDRLLVTGPSGSGKSTLLAIASGVVPEVLPGTVKGEIKRNYRRFGLVSQNPYAQMVTPTVETEIGFALENRGIPREEIFQRIEKVLSSFGLEGYRYREPRDLSGGECQRVALAAALAEDPEILFLDEPTSFLDPEAAETLFSMISELDKTTTVVLVEHRIDYAGAVAQAYIRLTPEGKIGEEGDIKEMKRRRWFQIPVGLKREIRDTSSRQRAVRKRIIGGEEARPMVKVESLTFSYGIGKKKKTYPGTPVLRGADLELYSGSVTALLGANGSGKSTLLRILAGILPPDQGRIRINGTFLSGKRKKEDCSACMFLPQNPEHMFLTDTVKEELTYGLEGEAKAREQNADEAARTFGLTHLLFKSPFSLSEGEKRRLTLAISFLHHRRLVLLDEPTYGLDTESLKPLVEGLIHLKEAGSGVLLVTHSEVFAETVAERMLFLKEGKIWPREEGEA